MRSRRWVASLVLLTLTGTACVARGEIVADPSASTTASVAPTPSPTPTARRQAWAALSSDPAAASIAILRSRRVGGDAIIVAGVPSPDDREAMRELDDLVVVTSDNSGARLARSTGATVATSVEKIGGLAQAMADMVTEAADAPSPGQVVQVLPSTDPATVLPLVQVMDEGALALAVDRDVRAAGPWSAALRAAVAADMDVRTAAPDEAWKLAVATAGLLAPGGGQLLVDKRFIALYGTPGTPSLGVLGEQGVEAAHARAVKIAEDYDDGALPIVPTFEIIAAVASASATEDGDYSYGISFELIREWVDYAAANDIMVILDIQPGRTDFLTHAKQYEEFLVQPHVGLGLDPEWRLKDNQVHLRQIGTVDGAEINGVVEWLAGLVREHDLPQKMLIMHQFKLSMITNRDLVTTPDELLVVLHMDGQGGQPAKGSTYDTLIHEGQPWTPGWKNFYDEDHPMAGAARVLALEPQPRFISFQ